MTTFLQDLSPVWKPHKGQEAFLKSKSPIKVLACGRRWGKTDACAVEVVRSLCLASVGKHLLIAPTLDQASILFNRVIDLLTELADIPSFSGKLPELLIRKSPYPKLQLGGHSLTARSGHIGRSLRGNEATHIVIDEAAFVPEELITEIAMPMLATTNGSLTMISTPRGMNHFWRFFQMGQERRNKVWSRVGKSYESPHVSKTFLETQRELISERAYRVEYEAEFFDSEGRVFKTESIEKSLVTKLERFVDQPITIGIDWAKYSDYSAVAVVCGHRKSAQLWEIERFNGLNWSEQIERVGKILARYPGALICCDATGVGDPLLELLKDRFPHSQISGTVFTASSKSQLIDRLAWMFENGALQMEPQPDLLRELQHFESKQSNSGNLKLAAAPGYHDDQVIALALACQSLRHSYQSSIQLGGIRQFRAQSGSKQTMNHQERKQLW